VEKYNNMIANYFNDLQGYEYHEIPDTGFIMYRVDGPEFHIGHFYVKPEKRKNMNTALFGSIGEQIARERGCTYVSGIITVGDRPPEVTARLCQMYLKFGCHIAELLGNCIIFKKDLV